MVTGAPQLLWMEASGAQEDVGGDTEGKRRVERCGVDPRCGGEGSWHRDLMHKEKQKSHCQGFPLFHSSAGDQLLFPLLEVLFSLSLCYLTL